MSDAVNNFNGFKPWEFHTSLALFGPPASNPSISSGIERGGLLDAYYRAHSNKVPPDPEPLFSEDRPGEINIYHAKWTDRPGDGSVTFHLASITPEMVDQLNSVLFNKVPFTSIKVHWESGETITAACFNVPWFLVVTPDDTISSLLKVKFAPSEVAPIGNNLFICGTTSTSLSDDGTSLSIKANYLPGPIEFLKEFLKTGARINLVRYTPARGSNGTVCYPPTGMKWRLDSFTNMGSPYKFHFTALNAANPVPTPQKTTPSPHSVKDLEQKIAKLEVNKIEMQKNCDYWCGQYKATLNKLTETEKSLTWHKDEISRLQKLVDKGHIIDKDNNQINSLERALWAKNIEISKLKKDLEVADKTIHEQTLKIGGLKTEISSLEGMVSHRDEVISETADKLEKQREVYKNCQRIIARLNGQREDALQRSLDNARRADDHRIENEALKTELQRFKIPMRVRRVPEGREPAAFRVDTEPSSIYFLDRKSAECWVEAHRGVVHA